MSAVDQCACNDVFHFLRQPQRDSEDDELRHAAVRTFQKNADNHRWLSPTCFWFPHTGDAIEDTYDTLVGLVSADPPTTPVYVGYWLDVHGVAIMFTRLNESDSNVTTHVEMAILVVAVPNKKVMDKASGLAVTYPSYPTRRVPIAKCTRALLRRFDELATTLLPSATPKRHKGGETYDEPREVPNSTPVVEAVWCLVSDGPLSTVSVSRFLCVAKTVHAHVMWKHANLPGRRAWSWLGCKAMLRMVFDRASYKTHMLTWMTALLSDCQDALSVEHRIEACQKLCRRAKKLGVAVPKHVHELAERLHYGWHRWESTIESGTRDANAMPTDVVDTFEMSDVQAWINQSTGVDRGLVGVPNHPWSRTMEWHKWYWEVVNAVNYGKRPFQVPTCPERKKALSTQRKWIEGDPYLYSQAVLLQLAELCYHHQSACIHDPLLEEHMIELDAGIFGRLLLPSAAEMRACWTLQTYFAQYAEKRFDHVLKDTIDEKSYAHRHVTSAQFKEQFRQLEQLLEQRDRKRCEKKRNEIEKWLAERQTRSRNSHYEGERRLRNCERHCVKCRNSSWLAEETSRRVHEELLPRKWLQRNHVLFELRLPESYATFRDLLYRIQVDWTCGYVRKTSEVQEIWQVYISKNAGAHVVSRFTDVTLVSGIKSMLKDHSGKKDYTNGLSAFLNCSNPLKCTLAQRDSACCAVSFSSNTDTLIPKHTTVALPPPYDVLRPYLLRDSPVGVENELLAALDECPPTLPVPAYRHLGKLVASAHVQRLDMVLSVLEPSTPVDLNDVAVTSMVQQVLEQTGPPHSDAGWRRDSHERWTNERVCEAVAENLMRVLKEHELNWEKTAVLRMVVEVARRGWQMQHRQYSQTLTIFDEVLVACRKVCLRWIDELARAVGQIQSATADTEADVKPLRRRMILVACIGARTFTAALLSSSKSQWADWYRCVNTVKENEPSFATTDSRTDDTNMSDAEHTMALRRAEETVALLAHGQPPTSNASIHKVLDQLVQERMPDATSARTWTALSDTQPGWYETTTNVATIHVNVWTGDYLVDGTPVGRLDSKVMAHEDYRRLFGRASMEVYPVGRGAFRTKYPRETGAAGTLWYFTFARLDSISYQRIIHQESDMRGGISDQATPGTLFRYIPNTKVDRTLPTWYREHYAHWYDESACVMYFRSTSEPFEHTTAVMQWGHRSRWVTRVDPGKIGRWQLIHSPQTIASGRFERLDEASHVALWRHSTKDASITRAELLRYDYAFERHTNTSEDARWTSRECPGMYVDPSQVLGTLVGLVHRLVLTDGHARCILVPISTGVPASRDVNTDTHFCICLSLPNTRLTLYRYNVDVPLQLLRPASPHLREAWLYLVWLHAITAHALPDPFTNVTGTEHALHLLRNVGYPNRPYDEAEHDTLKAISAVSAKRKDYPEGSGQMESISWTAYRTAQAQTGVFGLMVHRHLNLSSELEEAYEEGTNPKESEPSSLPWWQRAVNRESHCSDDGAISITRTPWSPPNATPVHFEISVASTSIVWINQFPIDVDSKTWSLRLCDWDTIDVRSNVATFYTLATTAKASRLPHETDEDLALLWRYLKYRHRDCKASLTVLNVIWNARHSKSHLSPHPYGTESVSAQAFTNPEYTIRQCSLPVSRYEYDELTTYNANLRDVEQMRDKYLRKWLEGNHFQPHKQTIPRELGHRSDGNGVHLWKVLCDCSWARELRCHVEKSLQNQPHSLPIKNTVASATTSAATRRTLDDARWSAARVPTVPTDIYDAFCDTDEVVRWLGIGRRVTPLRMLGQLVSGNSGPEMAWIRQWAIAKRDQVVVEPDSAELATVHAESKWLALEVLMGIRIRPDQRDIADHLLGDAGSNASYACQLDMGKGKTSVILPMLALRMSDGKTLARIQVPSSLLPDNRGTLYWKLGLLGRRCLAVPCTRKACLGSERMYALYTGLCRDRGLLLNAPEHIWSFALRADTVDSPYSKIVDWVTEHVVDVLDEADDVLHPRHQLIYPHGIPMVVDGEQTRWTTISKVVQYAAEWIEAHASQINVVFRSTIARGTFPQEVRTVASDPTVYRDLFRHVIQKVLETSPETRTCDPRGRDDWCECILDSSKPLETDTTDSIRRVLLVLRGCTTNGVLLTCLSARHGVDYGIDPTRRSPLAVPYRARYLPAERAEWSHPDAVIMWTYLSWFYAGLTRTGFDMVMKQLMSKSANCKRYNQWRENAGDDAELVPWDSLNLSDRAQAGSQFAALKRQMGVVEYWLDYFVYPVYAKTFPRHQLASACDTVRTASRCVGFSGTNGTADMLPVGFAQRDLQFTQDTNTLVDDLLAGQMHGCHLIPTGATGLQLDALCALTPRPRVIIDRGAVMDDDGAEVARQWLERCTDEVDGVVYYNARSERHVWTRKSDGVGERFDTSPLCQQLERCAVYLDDSHTRGVDFKFPLGTHAVVTLGRGVTRDAFAQACKRMRKLDHEVSPHTLVFAAMNEVFRELGSAVLTARNVLEWTKRNTELANRQHLSSWADHEVVHRHKRMRVHYTLDDTDKLEQMYAGAQTKRTYTELASGPRYSELPDVTARLIRVGAQYQVTCCVQAVHSVTYCADTLDQEPVTTTLDEEQERELQEELEDERQVSRPPKRSPHVPRAPHQLLHRIAELSMSLEGDPLADLTFATPAFANDDLPQVLQLHKVYVSHEYQRVCKTTPSARLDYEPEHAQPHTPYARTPSNVLFDTKTNTCCCMTFEEAGFLYRRLDRGRHERFVLLSLGRRLLSRAQPVLDEDQRLCVPLRATAFYLTQPLGLTILTGGVFYKTADARRQLHEWISGRKHIEGGVHINGSAAWLSESDVEPGNTP